jgi:hypothetical protein
MNTLFAKKQARQTLLWVTAVTLQVNRSCLDGCRENRRKAKKPTLTTEDAEEKQE